MLYELLQRNLASGMPAQAALASALAERERIERGQAPEVARGSRKERKARRKHSNNLEVSDGLRNQEEEVW